MTLSNELTAGVDAAIAELAAMGDAESNQSADAGPKPKGKKPAAKTKGKTTKSAAEVKAEAAQPKPEPKTLDGFELKDDADAEGIAEAAKGAAEAIDAIARKDADLLSAYLDLGAFNAKAAKAFKSTKIMGQYIAKNVPASQALDPALRSNCKWLWEALNDPEHEAFGNLLSKLGVNRLEDYKSGNPTVIRREYSALIKADELEAKAEALGVATDDVTKLEKDKAKAEFDKDLKAAAEAVQGAISSTTLTKADIASSVASLVMALGSVKGADFLNRLNMFKVAKAPKPEAE